MTLAGNHAIVNNNKSSPVSNHNAPLWEIIYENINQSGYYAIIFLG